MKKKLLMLLVGILPLLAGSTMAQTWTFDNSTLSGTIADKDSQTFTVDEVTMTIQGKMVFEDDAITENGVSYTKGVYGDGNSNSDGSKIPSRRFISFPVSKPGTLTIIGKSRQNDARGYAVMLVEADGTINAVGSSDYTNKEVKTDVFTVTKAGTIYLYYPTTKDIRFYSIQFADNGPSKDATLSSVTVNGEDAIAAEATDDFDYSYILPFDYNEATASVAATATSNKAEVIIPNEGSIVTPTAGNYTDITISVTPETGAADAKEYIVRVFKQNSANSDNSIAVLTVDEAVLTADEETGIYSLEIPYGYEGNPTITVTLTDEEYATYTVSEFDASAIAGGSSIDVTITVTAQNGAVANYTLKISRLEASSACQLTSFYIGGYKGQIRTFPIPMVAVQVMPGYDVSDTPVVTVSEKATSKWSWNEGFETVFVTAEDGMTTAFYPVNFENITPLAELPYEATFGTEYTVPEWMWGANYNSELRLPGKDNSGEIVGGIDIASDNAANQAIGTNKLNLYLSSCESITLNVGATGGRTLSCVVDGVELSQTEAIKSNEAPKDVTFTINKNEPTHVYFIAKGSNGGTRVYNIKIAQGTGTNVEQSEAENGLRHWSADGILYLQVDNSQLINLYSIDGSLIRSEMLNEGLTEITGLQKGIYLLNNAKVIIK